MAKLMSKKTKEIVKTTVVLVVIALIIIFYAIYPLIKVPDTVSRPEDGKFRDPEYTLPNNQEYFVQAGLNPDTLAVLTTDNIRLATLQFEPDSTIFDSVRGTAILLHPDDTDRTVMVEYVRPLLDSGLTVFLYDQRACGVSGGRFHFGGDYEGDDLEAFISDLSIHEKLYLPLYIIGFQIGADAAIYASFNEHRISRTIAVDPYITTSRWMSKLKDKSGLIPIPLGNTIYFWWFQKFSGFPYSRTGTDDLVPLEIRTTIYMSASEMDGDEIIKLKEITPAENLEIKVRAENPADLKADILSQVYSDMAVSTE